MWLSRDGHGAVVTGFNEMTIVHAVKALDCPPGGREARDLHKFLLLR